MYLYDVSDELFTTCFGYIHYKRVFVTELDTEERANHRDKNLFCINNLID